MSSKDLLRPKGWEGRAAMTASYRRRKRARDDSVEVDVPVVEAVEIVIAGEQVVEEVGKEVVEETVGGVGGEGAGAGEEVVDYGEHFEDVGDERDPAVEGDWRRGRRPRSIYGSILPYGDLQFF
ncbi:hypothetical protein Dimus_038148 [Dionaea muscipula]